VQYLQRARGAGGVLWIPVVFVAFWSSGYLVGDIGTRAAPPLALLFWRFAVALAVVTVIAFATTAPWPRGWRAWAHLAVVGVLLQTTQFAGVYFALARGTSTGLAALLVSCKGPRTFRRRRDRLRGWWRSRWCVRAGAPRRSR